MKDEDQLEFCKHCELYNKHVAIPENIDLRDPYHTISSPCNHKKLPDEYKKRLDGLLNELGNKIK